MTTTRARILATIGVLLVPPSCASPTSPAEEVLVVGTLLDEAQLGGMVPAIEVPDTILGGSAFVLTVRTMGDGCDRIGPTDVSVDGMSASIVPFEYTWAPPGSNVDCDLFFNWFEHRAALVFDSAGTAMVTVTTLDGNDVARDSVLELVVR